jgi:hypothetical protein
LVSGFLNGVLRFEQTLMVCVVGVTLLAGCRGTKSKQATPGTPSAVANAGVGGPNAGHGEPSGAASGDPAKVPSPSALSAEARAELTTILVSAHVGNVIARREGNAWVISGDDGCTVDPVRMKHALDNLSVLKAVPTSEPVPDGAAFRLQISALVGEKRVVHLELADRNEAGHLTRLDDDSMVRIQGLDVSLWSAQPADWCRGR